MARFPAERKEKKNLFERGSSVVVFLFFSFFFFARARKSIDSTFGEKTFAIAASVIVSHKINRTKTLVSSSEGPDRCVSAVIRIGTYA